MVSQNSHTRSRGGAAAGRPRRECNLNGGIRNTPYEIVYSEFSEWRERGGNGVIPPVRLLAAGVDTVHVGMGVNWSSIGWLPARGLLEQYRREARESDGDVKSVEKSHPDLFGGLTLRHHGFAGGGRKNYRYHLEIEGNHVWIGDCGDSRKFGNVFVKFGAEWLWRYVGVWGEAVRGFLDSFVLSGNGAEEWRHVSRLDLAADYLVPGGLDYDSLRRDTVPGKVYKCLQGSAQKGQTCYLGRRTSPVSIAVYDKGKELAESQKMWCLDLWGIDRSMTADVVRVESCFSRAFWRAGLDDPSAVLGSSGSLSQLWAIALGKIQWRVPDRDNVNRRSVHPFWSKLRADMAETFGVAADLSWKPKPSVPWDDITYLDCRVLPALAGWCERRGYGKDLTAGLRDLIDLVESEPRAAECLAYRGLEIPPAPF